MKHNFTPLNKDEFLKKFPNYFETTTKRQKANGTWQVENENGTAIVSTKNQLRVRRKAGDYFLEPYFPLTAWYNTPLNNNSPNNRHFNNDDVLGYITSEKCKYLQVILGNT